MGGGSDFADREPIPREKILEAYRAGPEAIVSLIQYLQDMYEGQLRALQAEYEARHADLAEQVKQLQERVHTDSHNSSKPPSSDGMARRPYPKRPKSKRKPGGQPGHEGMSLKRVAVPDRVVVHRTPGRCRCGCSLRGQAVSGYERRQVFDLPAVHVEVTEHRAEIKCCPGCGRQVVAEFPTEVKHAVQYGPRVQSTAIYLKDHALIPYGRLQQLMQDLFGVRVSAGTLARTEQQCAERLKETVDQIRRDVRAAAVVHFDETGLRVQGKLAWLHSASTAKGTYYKVHRRRGKEAMDAMGVLGSFTGVAVHDGWASYAGYGERHGLCNAHHLRELGFLSEERRQRWALALARELRRWKRLVDRAKERERDHLAAATVRKIEQRYEQLVHMGMRANPPPALPEQSRRGRKKKGKARSLVDRLWDNRVHVLRFVHDFRVPFDNNVAERDLRMMKVQQKISGTFRSWEGAEAFAAVRSYLSTIRKRGINVIEGVLSIFSGDPLLIAAPQTR
jgi:transposase